MKSDNYHILELMLEELQTEYDRITSEITSNNNKMKEADYFANSILENEDLNFKFFSPRDAESVHKDEIVKARKDKLFYQSENELLSFKKEQVANKIEQVKKILVEENGRDYNTLRIQEEERQRIARDLHDTSLQNLTHLIHKIELSSMYIDKDPLQAKLELSVISKNIRSIIDEIRNIIFDLRPMTFDDLGMKAALERLVSIINENKSYEIDINLDDVSCENNLVLLSIYRNIQECLTNIVKHAEATKIYLHCKLVDNEYHVVIKDNGKGFQIQYGFNREGKHFGLSLVQERVDLMGGTFKIDSDSNGTRIEMSIPIPIP